jgi:hypothetical protein
MPVGFADTWGATAETATSDASQSLRTRKDFMRPLTFEANSPGRKRYVAVERYGAESPRQAPAMLGIGIADGCECRAFAKSTQHAAPAAVRELLSLRALGRT